VWRSWESNPVPRAGTCTDDHQKMTGINSDAKHALYQMSYTPYNPISLLKDLPVYRDNNGGGGELGVRALAGMGEGRD
jgi:hypothetical protein